MYVRIVYRMLTVFQHLHKFSADAGSIYTHNTINDSNNAFRNLNITSFSLLKIHHRRVNYKNTI